MLSKSLKNSTRKITQSLRPKIIPNLTQSYYHNPGEDGTRLIDTCIDEAFKSAVQNHAQNTALIAYSENNFIQNYEELDNQVDRLADGLLSLGLEHGDKLAIWAPNIKEYVTTQFAAARAGLVLVTLNPLYTSTECEFATNLGEVKCIICPRGILNAQNYIKHLKDMKNPPKYQVVINDSDLLNGNIEHDSNDLSSWLEGTIDYRDLVNSSDANSDRLKNKIRNKSDDLAMIQFTSGTTGKPKAAAMSHHNIVNNSLHVGQRVGLGYNEPLCCNVPLFHCFGNVGGSLMCGISGKTLMLPFFGWNPNASLNAIEEHQAKAMFGTPTMYIDMFQVTDNNPDLRKKLDSLEIGVGAASLVPPEVVKKGSDDYGIILQVAYGSTENSPLNTTVYHDDTFENKTETVGRAIDHSELKIVDHDGFTVPINTPGELCTRGYQVFQGYLNNPEKTAEAIDDERWYHSGDLATMDQQGYIKIVGRIKDMIIRGGENVYPSEIEEFLLQQDEVLDVQVVGAPDYRLGEIVCAYVRRNDWVKESDEELIQLLKSKCGEGLAKFKIPKHWRIIETFPCTLSGKVKKFELREMAHDDFELQTSAN